MAGGSNLTTVDGPPVIIGDETARMHDRRFAIADEWMEFLDQIFTGEQPFDFTGQFHESNSVISEPRPALPPGPLVMSAGFSPQPGASSSRSTPPSTS